MSRIINKRANGTLTASLSALNASANTVKYAPLNATLHRHNAQIERCADTGNLQRALLLAKELRDRLARQGNLKPDINTYLALAKNFSVHGLANETLRVVQDARAVGVEPTVDLWNEVLRAHIHADMAVQPIITAMAEAGVAQNPLTRQLLIRRHLQNYDLEAALVMLSEQEGGMLEKTPLQTVHALVSLATAIQETRLATDLIQAYQKIGTRKLPESVYLLLARAAVNEGDIVSAEVAYEELVRLQVQPDEGLATQLLGLFSRHRKLELCERLVRKTLPSILTDTTLREWHLAPLCAMYISASRWEDALKVFSEIQARNAEHGWVGPPNTTRRKALLSPLAPSYTCFLDGMTTLEEVKAGHSRLLSMLDFENLGHTSEAASALQVPIELVNAVLRACLAHGLIDEMRDIESAIFRLAATGSQTSPSPDIVTFNTLFAASLPLETSNPPGAHSITVSGEEISHAQRLMEVLKQDFVHLQPNAGTYAALTEAYVRGPEETWDLAFDYLEEMKHFDIAPPAKIYLAILNRLVTPPPGSTESGDAAIQAQVQVEDERITYLLQEMAVLGYLGSGSRKDARRSVLSRDMRNIVGEARIDNILKSMYKRRPTTVSAQTAVQQRQEGSKSADRRSRRRP